MPQRTSFTTISPLPPTIRRAQAVAFLQDHLNMIDLNPLVKRRVPIDPPAHCPDDERHCTWYSITDSISYLPGGLYDGEVKYTAAFHDLPGEGMQSHSYAAMGVEIQGKWTVGGNEPGEKPEVRELGSEAPLEGLYLREECEVKCNMMMTRFIKKTILKSHGKLMSSLIEKAAHYPAYATNGQDQGDEARGRSQRPPHVHPGRSHTGRSASPSLPSPTEPSAHSRAQSEAWGNMTGSAQRWQDDGAQRPYATSSDVYLSQQQQRRGQDTYHSQRPYAGVHSQRRDETPPERPYLSSDVYLGQQQQGQQHLVYSNPAAAASSTPTGLRLYSNGPHQGGHMDEAVTAPAQQQQLVRHWPPAYTPGPTRQTEFAELA
ncbi:hypothetical protein NLU13_0797 [Sarocladium strictum]|uniref:DUF7053 domain-containing protein n=1 Tax=Sarocladium strictum TaxID=5046 RepID=A0AA39GQ03_SARSR|nr:hypothetical protein NLU13_0797 [Sarocladium strictum]